MSKQSAGILMFRRTGTMPEVLLVHPGGPFWAKKDSGAWSIPKGLYQQGQDPLSAARREFEEETGCPVHGEFIKLGSFKQPSGKTVTAWAIESDFDVTTFKSNVFSMEWPPRSGTIRDFPEVDRIGWFVFDEAMGKITKGQVPILAKLLAGLE